LSGTDTVVGGRCQAQIL